MQRSGIDQARVKRRIEFPLAVGANNEVMRRNLNTLKGASMRLLLTATWSEPSFSDVSSLYYHSYASILNEHLSDLKSLTFGVYLDVSK